MVLVNYGIELKQAEDLHKVISVLESLKSDFDLDIIQQENKVTGDGPYCSYEGFFDFFIKIAKCIPNSAFEGKIDLWRYGTQHTIYKANLKNKELEILEITDRTEEMETAGYQKYVEDKLPYEKFTDLLGIPAINVIDCESDETGFDADCYVDFIFDYFKDGDFIKMDFDEFEELSEDYQMPEVSKEAFENAKVEVKKLKITEDDFQDNCTVEANGKKIIRTEKVKLN